MSKVLTNEIGSYTGTDVAVETGKTISGTASQFKMTDVVQGDVLYGSAADTLSRLPAGTSGQVLVSGGAGANPSWGSGGLFSAYAILADHKTTGTDGGTFTQDAWQTRDLQTEVYDGIGITISSNEFTLPAGNYLIEWQAPAFNVRANQSRLYDVTNTTIIAGGSSEYSRNPEIHAGGNVSNKSFGMARVTPSVSTAYRIEHYCELTLATYGFGDATGYGPNEVYTQVKVFKES